MTTILQIKNQKKWLGYRCLLSFTLSSWSLIATTSHSRNYHHDHQTYSKGNCRTFIHPNRRSIQVSLSLRYTRKLSTKSNYNGERERERGQQMLAITDPLILYKSYLARGLLRHDDAQYRAAVEFQKLYYQVKDYKPPVNLKRRIKELTAAVEERKAGQDSWNWFRSKESTDLVKVISSEEELKNFPSPQGLMLHGDVGCGKSLLMDIFAESLPNQSKKRWHYNNFMLSIYGLIHQITKERKKLDPYGEMSWRSEQDFILLEIAHRLVDKSTILIIDEFMLPDIAAANIVKLLFTYFFKLGGVLVSTSNRLPEELYATDFKKDRFQSFYNILLSRCNSYNMNSGNDYRVILSNEDINDNMKSHYSFPYIVIKKDDQILEQTNKEWFSKLSNIIKDPNSGKVEYFNVYGRKVMVPWALDGVAAFTFEQICQRPLASADYITLSSNYHTFIIDDVPILKSSMKPDARRFISLIDSLYESKCRLILRCHSKPDDLFFPDAPDEQLDHNTVDSTTQETIARAHIDSENPYRPNVSSYDSIGDHEEEVKNSKKQIKSNFANVSAFTGEDEKFAFKRAISRIKEMTGSKIWWESQKWKPMDLNMRPWEEEEELKNTKLNINLKEIKSNENEEISIKGSFASQLSPNLKSSKLLKEKDKKDLPPTLADSHFWSMGIWGSGIKRKDEIAKQWVRGNSTYVTTQ